MRKSACFLLPIIFAIIFVNASFCYAGQTIKTGNTPAKKSVAKKELVNKDKKKEKGCETGSCPIGK